MKKVQSFNKVIGIIAFLLMLTSLLLTAVLNQAVVYAETANAEIEHVHDEHCAHESILVGENVNMLGTTVADPSKCATCGCKVYGCSQCYEKTVGDDGKTTYTLKCEYNKDKPCPLDVTLQPWYEKMMSITTVIDGFLWPIIIILGTAGSIFVIVLGVNFSKAESADKREEAKKRMINAIIGVVVTILLLILVKLFTNNAETIVQWINRT